MEDEINKNDLFTSAIDIEEERRKQEAADILYRAIKYIIGYLQGYRIEKRDNLKSNPMWILVKVYWKTEDIEAEIRDIEREIIEIEKKNDEERLKEAEKYEYNPLKDLQHTGD